MLSPTQGTCVVGSVASACELGGPGTPEQITPPDLCAIHLADDGATPCAAYIMVLHARGADPGAGAAGATGTARTAGRARHRWRPGAPGTPGADGADGADGDPGPPGPPGRCRSSATWRARGRRTPAPGRVRRARRRVRRAPRSREERASPRACSSRRARSAPASIPTACCTVKNQNAVSAAIQSARYRDLSPAIASRRLRRRRGSQTSTAFCACSRFSAWSNTTDCGPSITASVISSPRCAGRQCITSAFGVRPERPARSFIW